MLKFFRGEKFDLTKEVDAKKNVSLKTAYFFVISSGILCLFFFFTKSQSFYKNYYDPKTNSLYSLLRAEIIGGDYLPPPPRSFRLAKGPGP